MPAQDSRPISATLIRSILITLLTLPTLIKADRKITVINKCSFTLWPAVANYPQPASADGPASASYTGVRGWEAKAGTQQDIKIPELWNGRIWGRRDCEKNGDKLTCVVGTSYDKLLEPGDDGQGDTTMAEWNLVGWSSNEFYDLSNVAGFSTPISLYPSDSSCQGAICKKDLLGSCPDPLRVKDGSGATLGCLSACMAKQGNLEINCCSGQYENREMCTSDKIDYYDFFKDGCTNAYAFPFDDTTDPPVVFACPISKKTDYTLTFCPEGSGPASAAEGNADPTNIVDTISPSPQKSPELIQMDDESTTEKHKSTTSPEASPTPASSSNKSNTTANAPEVTSAKSGEGSGASASRGSLTSAASLGMTAAAGSSSSTATSSASSTGEEIMGMKPMVLAGVVGGALALVVIGLLLCLCLRKKGGQARALQQAPTTAASLSHRESRRSSRARRTAVPAYSSAEESSGVESSDEDREERRLMKQVSRRSSSRSRR